MHLDCKDGITVTAHLPAHIRGVRYVRNHHFVELEDSEGRCVHLPANNLMRCECTSEACGQVFWVQSNLGSIRCPHCLAPATYRWGTLQIAFVPECESDFPVESMANEFEVGEVPQDAIDEVFCDECVQHPTPNIRAPSDPCED